jgi:hypothetical protein
VKIEIASKKYEIALLQAAAVFKHRILFNK